jgi:hypothetical protein
MTLDQLAYEGFSIARAQEFIDVWDKIYDGTEYKYVSNPWVFVYEFERVTPEENNGGTDK